MARNSNSKDKAVSTSTSTRLSSLNGGPSPFPRRMPLPSSSSSTSSSTRQSSSSSAASPSNNSEQDKNKKKKEESESTSGSMAKKLTRFYTANFERRPVITLCVTNGLLSTIGDAAAQLIPIIGAASGAPVPAWDIERTLRFAMFGFSIGPMIEKWNRFLEYRFPLRPVSEVFEGPTHDDPNSPAFIEKLKRDAEKEGFKVNVDRGDSFQGQQYASSKGSTNNLNFPSAESAHRRGSSKSQTNEKGAGKGGSHIVDPQTVAMPNTGQPGQISIYALFQRVFADQLFMAPVGLAIFISTMAILEGLEWDEIVERYKRLYLPILLVNWQIWPFVQIINFRYLPLRYRVPFSASLGVLWTVFLSFKNAAATAPKTAA